MIHIHWDFTTGNELSFGEVKDKLEEKGFTADIETHCLEFFNVDTKRPVRVCKEDGSFIDRDELMSNVGFEYTDKEMRQGHNLRKMLVANSFTWQASATKRTNKMGRIRYMKYTEKWLRDRRVTKGSIECWVRNGLDKVAIDIDAIHSDPLLLQFKSVSITDKTEPVAAVVEAILEVKDDVLTFDDNGNVIKAQSPIVYKGGVRLQVDLVTPEDGDIEYMAYDSDNRLIRKMCNGGYDDGYVEAFTYNDDGLVATEVTTFDDDPDSEMIVYAYDEDRNLTKSDFGHSTFYHLYDHKNRWVLTRVRDQVSERLEYDHNDRIKSHYRSNFDNDAMERTDYIYDGVGNVICKHEHHNKKVITRKYVRTDTCLKVYSYDTLVMSIPFKVKGRV